MLREYCDKCKKEIDGDVSDDKKTLKITVPDRCGYSERVASITLCKKCFEEMEIESTVRKGSGGNMIEKEPETVDKLLGIIRELVRECMEE